MAMIKNSQVVAAEFYRQLKGGLADGEVLRSAMRDPKFRALYNGIGGEDDSVNDMSLCSLLSKHTQNAEAIDRIFRCSKLMRPKWDEARGDSTYGRITIKKVLKGTDRGRVLPQSITAAELMIKEFPEPRYAIQGILPEGLTGLYGKPKKGKSIFCLNIALGVSMGGVVLNKIPVEKGAVVYLALEDTLRRLQGRIRQMLSCGDAPADLHLYTKWPRMKEGGLELLEARIAEISDIRLVIIDTLQKFRAPTKGSGNLYAEDYETAARIKEVADRLGVCILIIHHLRKAEADDVFDTISGTLGLTGATDGNLVLKQTGENFTLHITGRDIDSDELAIKLDRESLTWNLLGKSSEVMATASKQKVFDALREEGEVMSLKEVCEASSVPKNYVKKILKKLIDKGDVRRCERGKYIFNKPIISQDAQGVLWGEEKMKKSIKRGSDYE